MALNYSTLLTETYADRSWLKDAAVILGASFLIALFAPITIHLPFTPVPIATQGHVVLVLAALLGSKRGALAVLTYLFQGAVNLPVFAGGVGGLAALFGPTGGYLLGYVAAAFVTGYLVERRSERKSLSVFAAMGLGNLVIYLFGLPWLARFCGWENALLLGLAPFVIGDLLKLVAGTKLLQKLNRV